MSRFREDIIHESRQPGFGSQDNRRARSRRFSVGPYTDPERSLPKPRIYRKAFAIRPTVRHLFTCNSPSSVSTTSLAQLHEKLTLLSPLMFTKVIQKIAATPELPALVEEEYECLNNSEPNPRSLYVLAGLDTTASTDQSAIIETSEKLHNKHHQVDLVNLLVEEALNYGQDKDSGIISSKVTQNSDIVENTPFAETAHRKKLGLKRRTIDIEEIRYTTDDSDVVYDTPCNDYDWKKRGRTKSEKTNQNNNDKNETLNEEAVDAYFCQQTNINYTDSISPARVNDKIRESFFQDEDSEDDCNIIDGIEIVEADIVDCVNNVLDKVCNDLDKCVGLLAEQQQQIDILSAVQNIDDKSNNTSKILKMNKHTLKSPKDITNELDNYGVHKITLKFKPKRQIPKKNTSRQKKAKCVKPPNNIEEDGDSKENTKSPTNATKQLIRKKRKLYSPKDDDNENYEISKTRKERRPSNSTESPVAACYKDLENAHKSRTILPRKRASTQPVISPKTKKYNDMFDKIKDNVVNNEKITLVDKKSDKDMSVYNMSSESDDGVFKEKKIQVQKRVSSSSLESVTKRRRSAKPVNYTSYYSSEDECQRVVKPKAVKQTKPRSRKLKRIQRTDLIDERMRTKQPEVLETSFVQEKGDMNVPDEPQPAVNVPVLETIPADDLHDEPKVLGRKPLTPNKQEIIKLKTEKSLKKECDKFTKPTVTKRSKEIIADDSHDKPIVLGRKPQTPNKQEIIKINTEKSLKKKCEKLTKPTVTKRSKEIIADDSHDEPIVSGRKPQTPNKQEIIKIKTEQSLKKRYEKLTKPTITKRSKEIIKNVPTERESPTVSPLPGLVVETEPSKDDLTSSLDANLLQKLKKIYTDVEDLSTTRDTQNLLLNVNNNDGIEVDLLNKTCHNQNKIINLYNSNDNAIAADNLQAVDIPDVSSEKSIKTGGRSPITGHNDLDESPPNLDALNESFQHRDVDVEGRNRSMTDFLVNMRNQIINSKAVNSTSPIIPITRMSTKDSARSNLCAKKISALNRKPSDTSSYIESEKSNPRVVLERISSAYIESQINPVTPKSKASTSRVVLTRMSSEKIEQFVTPTRTKKSSTTESPVVVLDRISSDEINKWLPMPENKDVVARKTLTRRKSVSKPCTSCESYKRNISPVKLNFDIADLTNVTSIRDTRTNRTLRNRTPSSTKTIKSRSNIEKLRTKVFDSLAKKVNDPGISSQETVVKSAETKNISNKEKTVGSTSETSKSVASVRRWIKKNEEAVSSKTDDIATNKEMLYQEMMEVLNTRLVEINEAAGEAMVAAFLKDHQEITCLAEKVRHLEQDLQNQIITIDSLKKQITALQKNKMDRACSLIRVDADNKARMVRLLKEDIERILK